MQNVPYLKTQCLAKSATSLALQSPLAFSLMFEHHFSLPISTEHPTKEKTTKIDTRIVFILRPKFQIKSLATESLRYKTGIANHITRHQKER